MFKVFILIALLAAVSAKTVSMSTDSTIAGVDGLNLKWEVPFKVDDYTVGFKYSMSELRKSPQSLFAKRTIGFGDEARATVNAEFDVASKTLEVATSWVSDKVGLAVNALADSKAMLKKVGASTTRSVGDFTVDISGKYDMLKKSTDFKGQLSRDDTSAEVTYNTDVKDIVLNVEHQIDDKNSVEPSISLTTGDVTYGYTRKWDGGSLATNYHPGDRADFKWTDKGTSGSWVTKASVPLENTKNTKVSFTRDWDY